MKILVIRFLLAGLLILLGGPLIAGKQKPKKPPVEKPPAPVIVIDPGHGGKDPGAVSKKKIREKDVTLQISKKLAASLRKKAGVEVHLTRNGDRFIGLEERNRVANRRQCDLFLSVHANASRNAKANGLEIYYLNKASDQASARLASRENEWAPKKEREIDAIVSDLIQTAATEDSAELAAKLQRSLQRRLQKKHKISSIRVKTALFYVLVGAKCPSLLIETGFITNREEGRRLKTAAFQRDLADSIAEGVSAFLKTKDRAGSDL